MKRKLSKIYTLYAIIFFSIITFFSSFASATQTEIFASSNNVKVVDGDSLEINNKRIRLMGIDAPEYMQTCKDNNNKLYKCGHQSTTFLKNLIKDKSIKCLIHKKDQYDRFLCTCYIDDLDINKEMIKKGQAITYLETNYHQEQLFAKQNKLGIWSGDFIHPRLFRLMKEK